MKKFNQKFAPLFIAGTAIFFLGTAYKFVFGKKDEEDHDAETEVSEKNNVTDHHHKNQSEDIR